MPILASARAPRRGAGTSRRGGRLADGLLDRQRRGLGRRASRATEALAHDRALDAPAVAEGVQLAEAVVALRLEARDLDHAQASLRGPDVDERLDLEAVAV